MVVAFGAFDWLMVRCACRTLIWVLQLFRWERELVIWTQHQHFDEECGRHRDGEIGIA